MAVEYFKPMLDIGSPRVFNCNILTRQVFAKDPAATPFFKNKQFNNMVLIKDTIPESDDRSKIKAIGTKLYFPFNEKDIYEGGRTIFAHDKHLEQALAETFGQGALSKESLAYDLRAISVLDRLPSLDPFLLKDAFLNEGMTVNEGYFDVGQEVWTQIQTFILQRFEPVVSAAFPDALASDERAQALIEKIWEARDLDALAPLIAAFRIPRSEALEIFSAWKGVNFYSFQREKSKQKLIDMITWLKDLTLPVVAVSATERNEIKAQLELARTQVKNEWQKIDGILRDYQIGYDKMFRDKTSSSEFVAFLKNSSKLYNQLGYSLGKTGQASYCWDVMSKRFPGRKMAWDQMREVIHLLAKIFKPDKPAPSSVAW